jgi:indole-3-glycerol phosphate synthase
MPSLEQRISSSRKAVEERSGRRSLEELERVVDALEPIRPFTESIVGEEIALVLRPEDVDATLIELADEAGIAGIAVGVELLPGVTAQTELPALLTDLVVDGYQLVEARADGARGVLLVAAAFEDEEEELESLYGWAADLGLDVILEVADEDEIEQVLELLDPDSFLVRNRGAAGDIDLERTFSLLEEVPAGKSVMSWGGVRSRDEVRALERAGVDALVMGPWVVKQGLVDSVRILRGDAR